MSGRVIVSPVRVAAPGGLGIAQRVSRSWANGWLRFLFWTTRRALWVPRITKPMFMWFAWRTSRSIREGTTCNARWLLGASSERSERVALGKAVMANFYDAVVEFGSNQRRTKDQILARLEAIEGQERYTAVRACGRGAILVTAHLGSFETAITMLAAQERRIHVVFRRDPFPVFEKLRTIQHARLGIIEAPVDDGLAVWFGLRDALRADEVVLMQGDRVVPGQKGVAVPFLGGHMHLPPGPVKLAAATGAPIVPVFALTTPRGRVRIIIEEAIWVGEERSAGESRGECMGVQLRGEPDPALIKIAAVIGTYVSRYPEQWLCLHKAWVEDAAAH